MVVEIPYVEINNYKLPLLKTKMECPKLNKEYLVYALPEIVISVMIAIVIGDANINKDEVTLT